MNRPKEKKQKEGEDLPRGTQREKAIAERTLTERQRNRPPFCTPHKKKRKQQTETSDQLFDPP